MINVIISAYACSPSWGSEQGIGWNWSVEIAKYCRVTVITEGEFKDEIEKVHQLLPQKDNIKFVYNNVTDKVRKMCWNQGDWRFYWYYRQWQKKTLEIARGICQDEKVDVVHHLTMQGFREPGLLWKIDGVKFVWGPVGGFGNMPIAYLRGAGFKMTAFRVLKNTLNTIQFKFQPNVRRAMKKADAIIAATSEAQILLKEASRKDVTLINDTGCTLSPIVNNNVQNTKMNDGAFNLIWAGKFDFRKQLSLALQTMAQLKNMDVKLHILGTGDEVKYKNEAKNLGVSDKCVWYGQVKHEEVDSYMRQSDLFFFTSISEATSTVVMEALQNCLPILCFDTCGFASVVTEDIGVKIPLSTPSQSVNDFSNTIRQLYEDRRRLESMSLNCSKRIMEYTWESKAKTVYDIYKSVLSIG